MADDSTTDSTTTDQTTTDQTDDSTTDSTTDDSSSSSGSDDRATEIAGLHREAARYRKELRDRDQKIEALERAGQSDQERAVADARKETEQTIRGEYDAKLRASALRAAAAGLLHDPEDAVRYVDPAELGDDEARWGERARKAVEALLEERDYLGGADQAGARGLVSAGGRGSSGGGSSKDDSQWLRTAARRR